MLKKIVRVLSYVYPYTFIRSIAYFNRLVRNECLRRRFKEAGSIHILAPYWVKGEKYIEIGDNFRAGSGFNLEAYDFYEGKYYTPKIKIGNNVSIGNCGHISVVNSVTIGDNVLCASKVFIGDHSHGKIIREHMENPPLKRQLYSKGEIVIEDNVWVGDGACILSGVTIGKGAIIGSNAVVTKNIPPYGVAVGIPAKVIKYF